MKKGTENMNKNTEKNIFYKTNPRRGISLIVLVITIIVVIILAAAVIISLQNNNPMVEANKARINSDVANMQAIFINTVGKVMAENQDVVTIVGGQLYTTPTGPKKTRGEATYQILGTDGIPVVEGKIKFEVGEKTGTTYYTGKELPLYGSDTKWSVDNQGLLSVVVGGVTYGEGAQGEEEGEEIAKSDNPKLQSWFNNNNTTDFHVEEYRTKITKARFAVNVKVPNSKIESWDVSEAKDGSVMAWVEDDGAEGYILTIAGKDKIIANDLSGEIFKDFIKLKEIENIGLLDVSTARHIGSMFSGCTNLINVDLSSFNTSNVTYMGGVFYGCTNLKSIDLSGFNTSNVIYMESMFQYCTKLESINFGENFDTNNVTNMYQMFRGCASLTSIDLSNFDTHNVTSMYNMFEGCTNLTSIDLSSFNTSNVTDMEKMFSECKNLKSLNLGQNFDISKVTRMNNMFYRCYNLTTTIKIQNNSYLDNTNIKAKDLFENAAIYEPAQITLNYTTSSESIVDRIIAGKETSNIVKGVQVD